MGLVSAAPSMTKTNCVALDQSLSAKFISEGHCYCMKRKLHVSFADHLEDRQGINLTFISRTQSISLW